MPDDPAPSSTNPRYGFVIVIAGFVVVLTAFLVSVLYFKDAKEVTTAVGAVTGTVGTLAGAFFGVHVGAAGKERAEAQRDAAQAKFERLAAMAPPDIAKQALNIS